MRISGNLEQRAVSSESVHSTLEYLSEEAKCLERYGHANIVTGVNRVEQLGAKLHFFSRRRNTLATRARFLKIAGEELKQEEPQLAKTLTAVANLFEIADSEISDLVNRFFEYFLLGHSAPNTEEIGQAQADYRVEMRYFRGVARTLVQEGEAELWVDAHNQKRLVANRGWFGPSKETARGYAEFFRVSVPDIAPVDPCWAEIFDSTQRLFHASPSRHSRLVIDTLMRFIDRSKPNVSIYRKILASEGLHPNVSFALKYVRLHAQHADQGQQLLMGSKLSLFDCSPDGEYVTYEVSS